MMVRMGADIGREKRRLITVVALLLVVLMIPIASAARNLRSGHDALKVQELFKRLNKPPLQSIQSPDGDIIDCILINQQPAFDHPLLKNHVIQMRPSSEPKGQIEESNSVYQLWHSMNETCPDGTVPIRRTKEEDLLRAKSLEDFGKKKLTNLSSSTRNPAAALSDRHEYVVVDLGIASNYYGAKATINVWKPQVQQPLEFSLSQLWISGGEGDSLNTIEVGWQVSPQFYGDSNPRFFTYWTNRDENQYGCFNLVCSGFVQVSKKLAVGTTIAPVSVYGGPQYEITLQVWKDNVGEKWWLKLGEEVVGYWPSFLFTTLAHKATDVQFGGEILNLSENGHTATDMGSGHFPEEGFGKASYFKHIQTVDSNNNLQDPNGFIDFSTYPNCYNIKTGNDHDSGTYFLYGGPGNNPNCP